MQQPHRRCYRCSEAPDTRRRFVVLRWLTWRRGLYATLLEGA